MFLEILTFHVGLLEIARECKRWALSTSLQSSCAPGSVVSQLQKISILASRSTPPDSYVASKTKKISPLSSNKRINTNVGDPEDRDGFVMERSKKEKTRFSKPQIRRALFGKNTDEKFHMFGGSKNGSRVVPCHEDSEESVAVTNSAKDQNKNDKECEDLSLIRNQLSELEKQQSSLLDLLQVCHQCLITEFPP
ncbi:hypothetical protein K1719_041135 [Acacia pycnantha]|nr:hypothetical protein K1719_041135 [Acacia pycnantha]